MRSRTQNQLEAETEEQCMSIFFEISSRELLTKKTMLAKDTNSELCG